MKKTVYKWSSQVELRVIIAEIISKNVTYSHQTHTVLIHGAIDELEKLILSVKNGN